MHNGISQMLWLFGFYADIGFGALIGLIARCMNNLFLSSLRGPSAGFCSNLIHFNNIIQRLVLNYGAFRQTAPKNDKSTIEFYWEGGKLSHDGA